MRALTPLLFSLFLAAGLGPVGDRVTAADNPPGPEGKATVAFEILRTNHMIVRARINGQGPFHLIFDLGAPITLLSTRVGQKSGVIGADAPRTNVFSGPGEGEIDRLEIGDLTARDVPVIVLDPPVLRELGNALGGPVDGIIGHTFFARYRTTIDHQVGRVTFEPVAFQADNLLRFLPERLAGPKVARQVILAPSGLWGLSLASPAADLEVSGVPIRDVLVGSPAAAAGLRPGDVLTTLDGRWTISVTDAYAAAAAAAPGRDVTIVILRNGRELTLTVRPRQGI